MPDPGWMRWTEKSIPVENRKLFPSAQLRHYTNWAIHETLRYSNMRQWLCGISLVWNFEGSSFESRWVSAILTGPLYGGVCHFQKKMRLNKWGHNPPPSVSLPSDYHQTWAFFLQLELSNHSSRCLPEWHHIRIIDFPARNLMLNSQGKCANHRNLPCKW
jgi:hypothetical protein